MFGAWVDLRPGRSFGQVYTCELDPSRAIYVPRGVGNSYQALEAVSYTHLSGHDPDDLDALRQYLFPNDPHCFDLCHASLGCSCF